MIHRQIIKQLAVETGSKKRVHQSYLKAEGFTKDISGLLAHVKEATQTKNCYLRATTHYLRAQIIIGLAHGTFGVADRAAGNLNKDRVLILVKTPTKHRKILFGIRWRKVGDVGNVGNHWNRPERCMRHVTHAPHRTGIAHDYRRIAVKRKILAQLIVYALLKGG